MSRAQAREVEAQAVRLLERATATLDLTRMPEALGIEIGEEAALISSLLHRPLDDHRR
jgi:hypothetical protein